MKKNKYEIDMCNGTIMDKLISFSLPLMVSGRKGWPAPSRMPKPSVCTLPGVIIPSAMPGME